ncbi:odv-ec43 [Matsumuraeses phaseoli granulovirus]|uniref:Odv-ec43 n=1 Tax=Matsumuraeses phaseoli granulovirus TaxID=2760664 RepID=A0AAE7MLD5_9BBAC|nr:odv-ec43 [Matsumuraeses phaseoli granulovirus]QOD40010.1 odv-ec43 [Matsumuraeses phaseoli granulovirus]
MVCSTKIKVYISDKFIKFPYGSVTAQQDVGQQLVYDLITIFVPTFADEKAILAKPLLDKGFKKVKILKYVANFEEDEAIKEGVVVYWNAIVPINVYGVGVTNVFNVVLSDNLYTCNEIIIDNDILNVRCPLQVDYHTQMVCLQGEYAGDSEELKKASNTNTTDFIIHFEKETPMGIKILNTKRFLVALSMRTVRANVNIYLSHDELATIHKELSWEATRRKLRGGTSSYCSVVNKPSYKYILDSMALLGIDADDISVLHRMVEIFNPLILRYKLVPNIFVELNSLNGEEKHVRLYCKYEGVAITNAGPVPLNMPTTNAIAFSHKPITPLADFFYRDLGTRKAFIHSPVYNYFL